MALAGLGIFILMQNNSPEITPPPSAQENINENIDNTQTAEETIEKDGPMPSAEEDITDKEIVIVGSNFKFDVTEIRVKKGDTVEITLKSEGGPHDFKIDELSVATEIVNPGEIQSVQFVANQVGQFEYYCSVGNHRQMGMKGMLIVEE